MPKMQAPMAHPNRTMPYPYEVQSQRSYSQDYPNSTNERASTAWTTEDDNRLMQFRTQGMNWGPIAANFPGKTPNACRKRHERLMEKKNAESWDDGIKIEDLSRAYLEVREQMWKILADALGEKWQTVETKCMEKGLKTLTTAGRAARRNDLAKQNTPPISRPGSEFEDSGSYQLIDHSPASINTMPVTSMSGHLAPTYYSQPVLPSQTRQGSISSNSSYNPPMPHSGMTPIPQDMSIQPPYSNYSSAQAMYAVAQPSSPYNTYLQQGYSPFTQPAGLPNLNQTGVATTSSRGSPLASVPVLPPLSNSSMGTSHAHNQPITTRY